MPYIDRERLQLQVLVVCRANICRSPFGAEIMRQYFRDLSIDDVVVRSAGSDAAHGSRTCAVAASFLRDRRELPSAFESRPPMGIDEASIRASDLILTMGQSHRSAVIAKVPAARNRTFTIVEARLFAQAAARDAVGREDPHAWAGVLNGMRGLVSLDNRTSLLSRSRGISIDDGHAKPRRAHHNTLVRVERECHDLVKALAAL